MVRLILIIVLILFVAWILRPVFRSKGRHKTKTTVDRLLDSEKNNFWRQNTLFFIIAALIVIVLLAWLLPRLGINFFALLQKIVPVINSLRGILPF